MLLYVAEQPRPLTTGQHTATSRLCFSSGISLSLCIKGHFFPVNLGLAGFIGAKDDGSGGDNWSYKTSNYKVLQSNHHQQTNFYRLDALPVAQPTVSE